MTDVLRIKQIDETYFSKPSILPVLLINVLTYPILYFLAEPNPLMDTYEIVDQVC